MFNPNYCLFGATSGEGYTQQINPESGINSEHLQYFRFIGRVIGMAIFHRRFLVVSFATYIYKLILGKPVSLQEMGHVDAEFFRSLEKLLKMDDDELDMVCAVFADDYESFGQMLTHDLKPNGRDVPVTTATARTWLLSEHYVLQLRLITWLAPSHRGIRQPAHRVAAQGASRKAAHGAAGRHPRDHP